MTNDEVQSKPTIPQKLDDLWHRLFDDNRYEVLTIHGWQETELISVDIGESVTIAVVNPDAGKEGQPASLILNGTDNISLGLRKRLA